MISGIIVTMKDIRACRMCRRGTRDFFVQRGWDWTDFLENGRAVEDFEATGDAMAIQVAETARGRQK